MPSDLSEQMMNLLEKEYLPFADDATASLSRVRRMPKNKEFFPEESLDLLEKNKPELREKRISEKIDENIQTSKRMGTGLITGIAALPSDAIEGVNYINDLLAEAGSPKALLFKDALNEVRIKYGREAFDKKFTELTVIESDGTNMDQIIGEVFSPAGVVVGGVKVAAKGIDATRKFYDFLKQAFEIQTKGVNPLGQPQLVDGVLDGITDGGTVTNVVSKNAETIKSLVDAAKVGKTVQDPNRTDVNFNVIGVDNEQAQKYYEIESNFVNQQGLKAVRSATVENPSGMTPIKEINKLKDQVSAQNYKLLNLEQKQMLYKLTGIYRGKDGKLKRRLDIRSTTLTQYGEDFALNKIKGIKEGTTVKDLLNQQDIFKNYTNFPVKYGNDHSKAGQQFINIGDIKVKFLPVDESKRSRVVASYTYNSAEEGGEVIYLSMPKTETTFTNDGQKIERILRNQEKVDLLKKAILHELQHAIQRREGFNNGASVQQFYPDGYVQQLATVTKNENLNRDDFYNNILGIKFKKDKNNNVFFVMEKKNLQANLGIGANADEVNQLLKNGYNGLIDQMVKREYDSVLKGHEPYTGFDNLNLNELIGDDKFNAKVMFDVLKGNGILDSVAFKEHLKIMIDFKKKKSTLADIEKNATINYLTTAGEQEAFSINDYFALNLRLSEKDLSPKAGILFDEKSTKVDDFYGEGALENLITNETKKTGKLVDIKVGGKNNLEQSTNIPNIKNLSPITKEIIIVDTPDTVKSLFLKDTERAKELGGEIINQDYRAPKFRTITNQLAEPISLDELNKAKKEIYNMTQLRYKDLPEEITVYRVGKLNQEDGVSSFSLDPNYNVELNLPWQKGRDNPLVAYKVKKSDILASPDFAEGVGRGRTFDEEEVIIDNDKVKIKNGDTI